MEDQGEVIKHADHGRRVFLKAAGVTGVGLVLLGSRTSLMAASKQQTTGVKPMNPKTTAIVLIEYQNDFTTSGGVFHDGVKGVMQSNNMLSNTIAVVNRSREAGVAVMHAPITFAEGTANSRAIHMEF